MTDWLTDERKSLILGAFTWAFSSGLGYLAAAWLLVALIVGSVRLVIWIGGL